MKNSLVTIGIVVALMSLSACERQRESQATSTAAPPSMHTTAPASSATGPTAGIVPHNDEKDTVSGATGPAEASTAIGGLAGNQEKGGKALSSAPEPSGGDGSASKPGAASK